jgi:hypothetical protein
MPKQSTLLTGRWLLCALPPALLSLLSITQYVPWPGLGGALLGQGKVVAVFVARSDLKPLLS